jgi:hypothetical protein
MLLFSLYLLTASGINARIGDVAILRLEVAKSIIERGDISVSAPKEIEIRGSDGRGYSLFGIGSVLLALPFYALSKSAGLPPENVIGIMNQIAGAITAVVVFLFGRSLGYTRRASLYISLCYALGTFAWYYAKEPGDHAIETLFCLLSVYFMHRFSRDGNTAHILLSSISLGLAFLTRPTSLLFIPPLIILMVATCRADLTFKTAFKEQAAKMLLFLSVLIPFAAIFFWYNHARFGSIFETGYTLMAERLGIDFFTGTPILTGLLGFLASPGKGFFYYSPIALLFFFSFRHFGKRHPVEAFSFACIIVSYLFFMSKNIYWHGDWAWGPRYLAVITPYMIIPLAGLFDSTAWDSSPLLRKGICALFVLSLAIQLMSVSIHVYNYFNYLQDAKVPFSVARGEGAPEISEPLPETYFDLRYAPIPIQSKLILSAGKNMTGHVTGSNAQTTRLIEDGSSKPWLNAFDFWWLYRYRLGNDPSGFLAAGILSILSAITAVKLLKATV